MEAERKKFINGFLVKEFYWNGKFVVYVNNKLVDGDFETICENLNRVPTKNDLEIKKAYSREAIGIKPDGDDGHFDV